MYDWLDGWLRALPGAEHGYKEEWNWHRYTVRGRHFAALCTPDSKYKVYGGHPLVNLKCDPRLAEGLREQYPEILPGFYCDKRTWIAVLLDGEPITRANIHRLSFATCEHSFFPALTPADHRDFYRSQFPRFREKRFAGLMEFFALPMDRPIRRYSAGQKNQFEVILALSQGADYILMDEPFAGNDVFNRDDFYKVLLGILEPQETVLLSTHLIEEVSQFVSRAVLLRGGEIVGDAALQDLEETGQDLMGYVRSVYHYQPDRVSRALSNLTEEEDAP